MMQVPSTTAVTMAVYDAIGITDMLPEFGGDTGKSDNFFSSRNGGLATYRNSGFFGG